MRKNLNVLGKRQKKAQKFSSSNRKNVTEIDEDGNESVLNISSKIKFIVSTRFMVTSLSNLVDNLTNKSSQNWL